MTERWQQYLATVRDGDTRAAMAVVDAATAAGADVTAVYVDVLQPALREIGRLWQANELTVADEHLATAITQTVMASLFSRRVAAGGAAGPMLIAACTDSERHEVGLRMLCDTMELDGWRTAYLGAAVPLESLLAMIGRKQPDVLALSATIAPHLPRVRDIIMAVREELGGAAPLIIVGGRAFLENPRAAERVGADLTAADAREALVLLNRAVGQPTTN